jgi:soluble cytochrome b562
LDYGINDTHGQSDGFKKIVELLNLANELSEKGDFEGAKKIFSEVARLKQKLPEMYIKNKVEVVDNILNLDRNMVETVKERALKEFLIKEKEIMITLSQSKSFAQRGRIFEAEKALGKASKTFNELPSGFIEKKAELQEKLLTIKKRLLRIKAEVSLKKLEETTKQFNVIMNKIDQFLLQGRVAEARECIALGNKLIDSLSDEFINEKKDFLEEIQKATIKIDNSLEEKNKGKLSVGLEEISKQIALVEKALKVGETDVAVKGYVEASSKFKNLPEGFVKEKIPIQEKLLDLYSEINTIVVRRKIDSFNKEFDIISQQIKSAYELADKGDLKSAQQIYQDVIAQYETLPGGFLERKTVLRLELLNLYDKIRQTYDKMKESEFSSLFLLPK